MPASQPAAFRDTAKLGLEERRDMKPDPRDSLTRTATPLADRPPASDHLTDYDRSHLKIYARLLDAAAERADWREVASVVLGLDPCEKPEQVRRVHDAHLERARWMSTTGYRDLLGGLQKH